MIHRDYFYDNVRHYLAGGSLNQEQVDGLAVLLDWFDDENPPLPDQQHLDDRMFAYALGTAWHESAFTVQPVVEYGGEEYLKSKDYYPWYGRGLVQLTWRDNYERQDVKLQLGGKLLADPDLALQPDLATKILVLGMADGDFTGKKLGDYFTSDLTDFYNARRIVNGTDKAEEIAVYAEKFHNAIGHL
jgi:hypothetical protein